MSGTYEYMSCSCPYQIGSTGANLWFKHKYDEDRWELVCVAPNAVISGDSRMTDMCIFRRWVEYCTPVEVDKI